MKSDLLSVVLFAIGVIFGIASLAGVPSKHLQTLLFVFFLVLLLTALFLSATSRFGLISIYRTLQACSSLGIGRVYSKGKEHSASLMSKKIAAATELRIMSVSGQAIIKAHKAELVSALRDNAALIRVLVAEPHSQFVKDVEEAESANRRGQVSLEIEQVEALLREYRAEAVASGQVQGRMGSVWMGHFTTHLRASLLVCDDKWCWYTPSLPPKRSVETFSLELVASPSGLLNDCISHFDTVWNLMKAAHRTRELQ